MPLSPAQLTTLKANIAVNTATIPAGQPWTGAFAGMQVNAVPNSGDGNAAIAGWYNLLASPVFVRWKKTVPLGDIGVQIDAAELGGLTALNNDRLQTLALYMSAGVNPSLVSVRAFFDDVFSGAGGAQTRANLLALWKRSATNAEKLYATGTGTDANPATSAFAEGFLLTADEVQAARALP